MVLPLDEVFKKIPHKKTRETNSKKVSKNESIKASKEVASTLQDTIQVTPKPIVLILVKRAATTLIDCYQGRKQKRCIGAFTSILM